MILVKNRELIIPREEFNIGTAYDASTEQRIFRLTRVTAGAVDLSGLLFKLDIEYANGGVDTVELTPEIQDEFIFLTLPILHNMLQVPGTMLIQIRALDLDGNLKWTSFRGALFVEDAINTPGKYTGELTELEQFEVEEEQRRQAEKKRVTAEEGRVEAEKKRVEAEEKRESDFKEAIDDFNNTKDELKSYATEAESYAHGGTGTRDGEDTDNARYYSEQAGDKIESGVKEIADTVTEGRQTIQEAADTAKTEIEKAGTDAKTDISSLVTEAESYTHGGTGTRDGEDTDNAKYYYEQIKDGTAKIDFATRQEVRDYIGMM